MRISLCNQKKSAQKCSKKLIIGNKNCLQHAKNQRGGKNCKMLNIVIEYIEQLNKFINLATYQGTRLEIFSLISCMIYLFSGIFLKLKQFKIDH